MSKRKTAQVKLVEVINEIGFPALEQAIALIKAYEGIGIKKFIAISNIDPNLENTKLQSKPRK